MFNKRVREHFIYTKLCFLHQTRSKKAALKSLLYNFSNIKPFKYKKNDNSSDRPICKASISVQRRNPFIPEF